MQLGETLELPAATVEVTGMTDDNRPAEATFRFRVPLEDKSLRWVRLTGRGYRRFVLPEIGETVEVRGGLGWAISSQLFVAE
jgi:hypothetical protein